MLPPILTTIAHTGANGPAMAHNDASDDDPYFATSLFNASTAPLHAAHYHFTSSFSSYPYEIR